MSSSKSDPAKPGNNIPAIPPRPLKPLDGHGITVAFDGNILTVTPTNKAAAVALLGQQHTERVLVLHARTSWASSTTHRRC